MRTKTMFAVLAASACAFAADFPTDQNAVITAPGTYTAAGNLSWTTLAVGGAGSFLFDLSGGPYTATLTGTGDNVMTLNAKDTDLTLKGGTWAFTGTAPYFNRAGGTRGVNRSLTLDGATMTGVNTFYIAYGGGDSDATLVLTNGASLTTYDMTTCGYGGGSLRTKLDVVGASSLHVTRNLGTDGGNSGAALGQRLRFDGKSTLSVDGNFTIGNGQSDIRMDVLNCSTATVSSAKTLNISSGNLSFKNHLVVSNKSSFSTGTLYLGGHCPTDLTRLATHDNSISVLDGSEMKIAGNVYIGGSYRNGDKTTSGSSNNVFLVENSTLTVTNDSSALTFEGGCCRDNVLRIKGASARFCTGKGWKTMSTLGRNNVFEIDGGLWTGNSAWRTGEGFGNTVRLVNGGRVDMSVNAFSVMAVDTIGQWISHGDSAYVGSDCELKAGSIQVASCDNSLTVSNGIVRATAKDGGWTQSGIIIGFSNETYGYRATNNVLRLQGDHPTLRSEDSFFTLRSNTHVYFEIPAGGYADGHVPIVTKNLQLNHEHPILVPEVEAFRAGLTSKTTITLMRATVEFNKGTIVADSNAVAPEGCTFGVGEDNMSIVLTVKPPKRGLMLIFR